jgi:uncharacterized protein (UPF0335 family)
MAFSIQNVVDLYCMSHNLTMFDKLKLYIQTFLDAEKAIHLSIIKQTKQQPDILQAICKIRDDHVEFAAAIAKLIDANKKLSELAEKVPKADDAYLLRRQLFATQEKIEKLEGTLKALEKEKSDVASSNEITIKLYKDDLSFTQSKLRSLEAAHLEAILRCENLEKENQDLKAKISILSAEAEANAGKKKKRDGDDSDFASQLFELNLNVNTLLSYKNDCILFRKISFKKRELKLKRTFKDFHTRLTKLEDSMKSQISQKEELKAMIKEELQYSVLGLKETIHQDLKGIKKEMKLENKLKMNEQKLVAPTTSFAVSSRSFEKVKENTVNFKTNAIPYESITYENNLITALSIEAREKFAFGFVLNDSQRQAVGKWWIHACYLDRSHMKRLLHFATTKYVVVARVA